MEEQKYIPRTALVACSRLVDFAGAEIASLEIAEALRDLGVDVVLAAFEIGAPVAEEIRLLGIECVDLSAADIGTREFDLLWVSHYVTAHHLFAKDGLKIKVGIYSSLSHFEALEAPPLSGLSFSRYAVHSQENLEHFVNKYPHFSEKTRVFPNACPAKFLHAYRDAADASIRSIAIVSNHPPAEIMELIQILGANGVRADLIGVNGKVQRVTPQLLSGYSAVITIGKTVQYCLASGTPVFCYDRFGGPGWITGASFDAALVKNFSGRCTPVMQSARQIYDRLFEGFELACSQRAVLHGLALTHFSLAENLLGILDKARDSDFSVKISVTDKEILASEARLFISLRRMIGNYQSELRQRDVQVSALQQQLLEKEHALDLSRRELASVLESSSWRLTAPVRRATGGSRLMLEQSRALLARARFVMRQEGVLGFSRKAAGYLGRRRRRLASVKQLERFVMERPYEASKDAAPLVSFVIPIYDRTDVLRTTIRSALEQSVQVFEVILVTDGSPAATLAVVNEFRADPRIRIFHYPVSSGNAVRGRNKGILEARGRYIAFLDSDDIAAPERLELCLPLLESGSADVVYGSWRALLDGSREIDGLVQGQVVHSPDCDLDMLLKICVPCQSTVMLRRDLLLRAGFLKTRMEYREDHELWVRLAYHGARFKSVPQVLTDLRLHAGNNELNFKANDAHWAGLIEQEFRQPGPKPQKIVFMLASLGISGGAAVVLKHVSMLMEAGHDAFILNLSGHGDIAWYGNPSIRVYGLNDIEKYGFDNIDMLFATFWSTVEWLEKIPARRKLYFVQSDERLFYDAETVKAQVAATYRKDYEYVCIAAWLVDMLRKEFSQPAARLVPNGLDSKLFYPDQPLQEKNPQRLRVLIEGPISVPFKGMAQAYHAVSGLDCELWIVSSSGYPEPGWRYDRFFEGVQQADMRRIYSSCDVLLKMSRVESFAYPPLEAMACGCLVVLGEVAGGIEYACDGQNVLMVGQGNIEAARAGISRLAQDSSLRLKLQEAGFATASRWDWERSRQAMTDIVEMAS